MTIPLILPAVAMFRVGKELHRELAIDALREGQSLNSYCLRLLRERRGRYGDNKNK